VLTLERWHVATFFKILLLVTAGDFVRVYSGLFLIEVVLRIQPSPAEKRGCCRTLH
jgi:hypothetical protein